ncbi:hypothetical protein Syun_009832 [Stephania yunnanensis]|uniref:Uncharacterized protein n=1 Tax=Stephania yunnanensis TaxID=152371 RepID=A0AAP0PP08_9MAGN
MSPECKTTLYRYVFRACCKFSRCVTICKLLRNCNAKRFFMNLIVYVVQTVK